MFDLSEYALNFYSPWAFERLNARFRAPQTYAASSISDFLSYKEDVHFKVSKDTLFMPSVYIGSAIIIFSKCSINRGVPSLTSLEVMNLRFYGLIKSLQGTLDTNSNLARDVLLTRYHESCLRCENSTLPVHVKIEEGKLQTPTVDSAFVLYNPVVGICDLVLCENHDTKVYDTRMAVQKLRSLPWIPSFSSPY